MTQSQHLLVFVNVNPDSVMPEEEFTRDVRNITHYSTSDLEIRVAQRSGTSQGPDRVELSGELGDQP